jgi:hypothetical protein
LQFAFSRERVTGW